LNNNLELVSAPPRDDERSYHVNSDRIKNELGLAPLKTIEDAVISIVDAYNGKLWTNYLDPAYNNVKKIQENQKVKRDDK
jgi:dTDP-D-glucose 4,6-dehydratase